MAKASINHPEAERYNIYLLISLNIDCKYPDVIDKKVMPFLSSSEGKLFALTRHISERYTD
jgi:hypothetical protein